MFSAAWRTTAKIAVNKHVEILTTRRRHATACQANRFDALDRRALKSLNRKSDVSM
jgi:hypothetical protein